MFVCLDEVVCTIYDLKDVNKVINIFKQTTLTVSRYITWWNIQTLKDKND